tara:strand:+ start:8655 stop:10760 length:2106 start_codon:yes stop_codon:yes gene_type:complete
MLRVLYRKPGRSGWSMDATSGADSSDYQPAIVGGRYRVTGLLSRSERSDVVTAVDVREDRQVVAKRIRFAERATGSRLRQAEQVLSGLNIRELAVVRGLIESRSDSWLIWDRVEGLELADHRQALGLAPGLSFARRWSLVRGLFDGLLLALESLHRSQLAHLDVKPVNVVVGVDGRATLVDLGVAEDHQEQGEVVGASELGFLSPEQVAGKVGDFASDQWALGAVLFYLLCGEAPVQVNSRAQQSAAYGRGQPQSLRRRITDVPEDFEQLLLKMLSWSPADRFADLGEVRQAFAAHSLKRTPAAVHLWAMPSAPLVGRDPFMTFFEKRLRELRAGMGSVLQLVAEPGLGKSRLLAAWEELARATPGLTLFAESCLPRQPRAALNRWFQPPACEMNKPPPPDLVEQAMANLKGPTVLLLDGLEEVDSIAWSRIHRAAGWALSGTATSPLLVVLAGRALPELAPRVDVNSSRFFNVGLPPLSPQDVAGLLRAEGSEEDDLAVRDSAARMLCEEAKGVPGSLMEILLVEEREGRMVRDGRRWIARVGHAIEEQLMRARPGQLDHILALVSILGDNIELELALRCFPQSRGEVLDALDWAAQKDLIGYRVMGDRWFLSLRTRPRALTSAQSDALDRLHREVAGCLEELGEQGGLCAERTALHWRSANDTVRAGEAYLRAARANLRVGSNSEARRLAQISSNLLPR